MTLTALLEPRRAATESRAMPARHPAKPHTLLHGAADVLQPPVPPRPLGGAQPGAEHPSPCAAGTGSMRLICKGNDV